MMILRIETLDFGIGVYQSGRMPYDLFEDCYVPWDMHPTPQEDYIGGLEDEFFCGFSDMDQLLNWFPQSALDRLIDTENFGVFEYVVNDEDIVHGEFQVAFVKANSVSRQHIM